MAIEQLLEAIRAGLEASLGENLRGIYVHGSLAQGDFVWQKSDVDFIAVVAEPLDPMTRRRLVERLMATEVGAPPRGLEMSVVQERYTLQFVYPTPYELHYASGQRQAFLADPEGFSQNAWREDYDLATHFALIREKGIVLQGELIEKVFGEVPAQQLWDSVSRDLDASMADLRADPIYLVLNLCRSLAYALTGRMLGKQAGAAWALGEVPGFYHGLIRLAAAGRLDLGQDPDQVEVLRSFCRYCRDHLPTA